MHVVPRWLLVACVLLTALTPACSPQPQPMKNGARAAGASDGGKPVPINPRNPKKFLQAEPEGPPPPPLKR
jgi:hypothetical protein